MKNIFLLVLVSFLLFSCNENNLPLPKRVEENATCWITFEGKQFYIGEDLSSIEKKIEIRPYVEVYPNEGLYKSPRLDVKYKEITWMRFLWWEFDKNLKLQSINYDLITSDFGLTDEVFRNFSEKNLTRFYQHIDSIRIQNKCNPPNITLPDSVNSIGLHPLYNKSVKIEWK